MDFKGDVARKVLSIRGGFDPSKMPKPETNAQKTSYYNYGQRLDPDHPRFDKELFERFLFFVGGEKRKKALIDFAKYLQKNYGEAPEFFEEVNKLKLGESTIGETIPLDTDAGSWIKTNMETLYKDWIETSSDTFYTVLAYFIGSKIPISFATVSDELKAQGREKINFTEIKNGEFSILGKMENIWNNAHPKPASNIKIKTVRRTSFLSWDNKKINNFLKLLQDVVRIEGKGKSLPLVTYFDDMSNDGMKRSVLKAILRVDDDLYQTFFRFTTPQQYHSAGGASFGRGQSYRIRDFAHYFIGNLDKFKQFKTDVDSYVLGEDLGEVGNYPDANPVRREEIYDAVVDVLRDGEDRALQVELQKFTDETKTTIEGDAGFFLNFVFKLVEQNMGLEDLKAVKYNPGVAKDGFTGMLNVIGFLNSFDVDITPILQSMEEAIDYIERQMERAKSRGVEDIMEYVIGRVVRLEKFTDLGNEVSDALEKGFAESRRGIVSNINELFSGISLNALQTIGPYIAINGKPPINFLRSLDLLEE